MSRGLRPGILSFSNGFERSAGTAEEQQQQQLRREKLRVQGFEQAAGSLQGALEEESGGGGGGLAAVYETGGMWSDMFNYPTGGAAAVAAEELMETNEIPPNYGRAAVEYWYGGLGPLGDPKHSSSRDTSGIADAAAAAAAAAAAVAHHHHHQSHQISSINAAESTAAAAAMQLFLMNPQPRSSPSSPPPPPPHHHHQSTTTTATTTTPLHFLLSNDDNNNNNNSSNPNPNSLQPYHHHNPINPPPSHHFSFGEDSLINNSATKIGGPVESQLSQGLSLTLSSSLAKVEEFRMGDDDPMFMYYGQRGGGGGGAAAAAAAAAAAEPSSYLLKNFGSHHYQQQQQQQQPSLHLQGVGLSDHAGNLIRSSSTTLGMMNLLRNSRYVRAARELLEEFCSVGRGELKNKWTSGNNIRNNNNSSNLISPNSNNQNGGGRGSSSSSKDAPPLSAADRIDYQKKKTKLLSMLDEVDRRYNHYCEQMQAVVNSFDSVMGFGAATPYTSLAQKAMSRHFRCLKDAIIAQMKLTCEALGEKDSSGATGITKGETPRLRALEQSLRQQRAFHQMGMMEQEAWRPQRGLPERSVNILRAWLFEHFLHPYPSDADKHLLSRQTGLSRNQVSNWFINARVRLWKPMVEEMYQKEAKELEDEDDDDEEDETMSMRDNRSDGQSNHSIIRTQTPAHAPTTAVTATSAAAAAPPPPNTTTTTTTTATGTTTSTSSSIAGKRTELIVNASESDPSSSLLHAMNSSTITTTTTTTAQCYPENQAAAVGHEVVVSPVTLEPSNHHHHHHHHHHQMAGLDDDTWRHAADFMRTNGASTLVNFRTATSGDISLTLGLRHAGNLQPEKNRFSVVRDFGDC